MVAHHGHGTVRPNFAVYCHLTVHHAAARSHGLLMSGRSGGAFRRQTLYDQLDRARLARGPRSIEHRSAGGPPPHARLPKRLRRLRARPIAAPATTGTDQAHHGELTGAVDHRRNASIRGLGINTSVGFIRYMAAGR